MSGAAAVKKAFEDKDKDGTKLIDALRETREKTNFGGCLRPLLNDIILLGAEQMKLAKGEKSAFEEAKKQYRIRLNIKKKEWREKGRKQDPQLTVPNLVDIIKEQILERKPADADELDDKESVSSGSSEGSRSRSTEVGEAGKAGEAGLPLEMSNSLEGETRSTGTPRQSPSPPPASPPPISQAAEPEPKPEEETGAAAIAPSVAPEYAKVYDAKMRRWWRAKVIGVGDKPNTYKVALYYSDGRSKCENAEVHTSKVKEVKGEEKRYMMEADKHTTALGDLLFASNDRLGKEGALTYMANYLKDSTNNIEAYIRKDYNPVWQRLKRQREQEQDAQSPRSPSRRSPSPRRPRQKTKRKQRSPRRKQKKTKMKPKGKSK